jgi:glycerophosphoryl diester phosphodiesterase
MEVEENALAAFAAAERLGYRYIEIDVRTTKDGVPVVFHDANLSRMTGRIARIEDLMAAEVGELSLPSGNAIPTLAEVLAAFPRLRFNIDLKDEAGLRPTARVLGDAKALSRVCITSFSERRVSAARRLLGPQACTGLGTAGVALLGATALLPGGGWTRGASVLQVPFRRWGTRLVTRRVVEQAHRAGLAVHVWTLNDRSEIEAALDRRVDGVMSDRLELLKETLEQRGLWHEPDFA